MNRRTQATANQTTRPRSTFRVNNTQEAIARFLVNREAVRIDLPMGENQDSNHLIMKEVVGEIKNFQRIQNPRFTVKIELNQNAIFMSLVLLVLTFSTSSITWLMIAQFNQFNQTTQTNQLTTEDTLQ